MKHSSTRSIGRPTRHNPAQSMPQFVNYASSSDEKESTMINGKNPLRPHQDLSILLPNLSTSIETGQNRIGLEQTMKESDGDTHTTRTARGPVKTNPNPKRSISQGRSSQDEEATHPVDKTQQEIEDEIFMLNQRKLGERLQQNDPDTQTPKILFENQTTPNETLITNQLHSVADPNRSERSIKVNGPGGLQNIINSQNISRVLENPVEQAIDTTVIDSVQEPPSSDGRNMLLNSEQQIIHPTPDQAPPKLKVDQQMVRTGQKTGGMMGIGGLHGLDAHDEDTNFDQYSGFKQSRKLHGMSGTMGGGILGATGMDPSRPSQQLMNSANYMNQQQYYSGAGHQSMEYEPRQNPNLTDININGGSPLKGTANFDNNVLFDHEGILRMNQAETPISKTSFVSRIPQLRGSINGQGVGPPLINKQQLKLDLRNLYLDNMKMKEVVGLALTKLEKFIEKTNTVKTFQSKPKPAKIDNEVYQQKQKELDATLKQSKDVSTSISKIREELENNLNYNKMIESENLAKEHYRQLQQLLEDNNQLRKISTGHEQALDTTTQQREKREEIRKLKEDIKEKNQQLKEKAHKTKKKEAKISDKHEQLVEQKERCRQMKEIIRLKKLEERNEIDNQVNHGFLTIGSPKGKKRKGHQEPGVMSEVGYEGIGLNPTSGPQSARNITGLSQYRSSKKPGSSKESDLSRIMGMHQGLGKVKAEDIEKLEKQCQRMIFEKEDKFLTNEEKLKGEEKTLLTLEEELNALRIKVKEKAQESNLIDFKIRTMARDQGDGYLKPHSGIHAGVLSGEAMAPLVQTIQLSNNNVHKSSAFNTLSHEFDSGAKRTDHQRNNMTSKQSLRSYSRYSIASRVSRYDDDTISMSHKRVQSNLPKIKVDRRDTNYLSLLTDNLKSASKKSNHSKSDVASNQFNRIPSHLRGANFHMRNSQNFMSTGISRGNGLKSGLTSARDLSMKNPATSRSIHLKTINQTKVMAGGLTKRSGGGSLEVSSRIPKPTRIGKTDVSLPTSLTKSRDKRGLKNSNIDIEPVNIGLKSKFNKSKFRGAAEEMKKYVSGAAANSESKHIRGLRSASRNLAPQVQSSTSSVSGLKQQTMNSLPHQINEVAGDLSIDLNHHQHGQPSYLKTMPEDERVIERRRRAQKAIQQTANIKQQYD